MRIRFVPHLVLSDLTISLNDLKDEEVMMVVDELLAHDDARRALTVIIYANESERDRAIKVMIRRPEFGYLIVRSSNAGIDLIRSYDAVRQALSGFNASS